MRLSIFDSKWEVAAKIEEVDLYDTVRSPVEMYDKGSRLITTSLFYQNSRAVGNPVIETPALWLDFDSGNFWSVCDAIEKNNCNFAAYTTFNHNGSSHRFRVIIPCAGLKPSNYSQYSAYFCLVNNLKPDITCRQASRVYYPPIKKPNAEYLYAEAGNRSDLLIAGSKMDVPEEANRSKVQEGLNEFTLSTACFQLARQKQDRNNTLYKLAFKYALTDINKAVISKQLYDAARKSGLEHQEILSTIRSAFAKAQMTSSSGRSKIDELFH